MTTATHPPEADPREMGAQMISLVEARGHLAQILGSDPATVERFKTVVLSAITSSPKLLRADPATLVQAMREAAMWNLEPDGIDAVIVPYWNSKRSVYEADFQATARGYVTVLYRSPRVLFVDADLIYEADTFEYEKGAVPRLVHKPVMFGDRGKRIGAYALVQLDTGFVRPIVLNEEAIAARRKSSRDAEKGAWAEWPDEMARKTALRALMSMVPIERGVKTALIEEAKKYPTIAAPEAVALLAAPELPTVLPALEAARAAFVGTPEPPAGEFTAEDMAELDAAKAAEIAPSVAETMPVDDEWAAAEIAEGVSSEPSPVGNEHDSTPTVSLGLSVETFKELCIRNGKSTVAIAKAIGCDVELVGARVKVMSPVERGVLADELGIEWRQ